MKRFFFLFLITGGLLFAVLPAAQAQDSENHAEIGFLAITSVWVKLKGPRSRGRAPRPLAAWEGAFRSMPREGGKLKQK